MIMHYISYSRECEYYMQYRVRMPEVKYYNVRNRRTGELRRSRAIEDGVLRISV